MRRAKSVLSAVFSSALLVGVMAAPALAVNDPLVPGDECSASTQAVGHPAIGHQQPQGANPPFSVNNPGVSTEKGAKAFLHEKAPC